jgi:opacity protein-like surface antigen
MWKRLLCGAVLLAALVGGRASPARAHEITENLEVYGYFQAWMTLMEQMEDAHGLFQDITNDPAADFTTGFRMARLRVGLDYTFLHGKLGVSLLLKLEGDPGMLDVNARWMPWKWLTVGLGQMRIPSTAENLRADRDLDFVLRTDLSDALTDFSLSRTNYPSSLMHGNRSYRRDFGLGVKGRYEGRHFAARAFLMMGNGLGANLFISGDTARGFLITNKAQFFWGARVELEPWPKHVVLGGHVSYNRHDNVVFSSGRTVLDIDRLSGSGDLELRFDRLGLRLGGLGGYGEINEDFNVDGNTDFRYWGASGYLLWDLQPMLRRATGGRFGLRHHIVLGFRYERYASNWDENPEWTYQTTYTAGVTYRYNDSVKVQWNAVLRRTDKPFQPDLDDDLYVLSIQLAL